MFEGEYWIFEDGSVSFCDGDIGDVNHEAYAIQHAAHLLGIDEGDDVATSMAKSLIEDEDQESRADAEPYGFCLDRLASDPARLELFRIACGNGDPRQYAAKHWRWHALRGHHVETWDITEAALKAISRGIDSVLEEEIGGVDFDDDSEMEAVRRTVFYIESFKGNRSLTMTYAELEAEAFGSGDSTGSAALQGPNAAVRAMDQQDVPGFYNNKLGDSVRRFANILQDQN